jgi:hypothetical protein
MAFGRDEIRTLDQHFRDRNARQSATAPPQSADTAEYGGFVVEDRPWMRARTSAELARLPFLVRYHYRADERYSDRSRSVVPTVTYLHGAEDATELVRWLRDALGRSPFGPVVDALIGQPLCTQCEMELADPPSTMCRTCRQDVAAWACE